MKKGETSACVILRMRDVGVNELHAAVE